MASQQWAERRVLQILDIILENGWEGDFETVEQLQIRWPELTVEGANSILQAINTDFS